MEDEINESSVNYSEEFKKELDARVDEYLNGGKMVTPEEMNERLQAISKKRDRYGIPLHYLPDSSK